MVFCLACPDDVKELFLKGVITDLDLYMAGFSMLCLLIEEVYPQSQAAYVVLFSNNSSTVGWFKRLTARGLLVAMQLV